jgi:hypothetical protein
MYPCKPGSVKKKRIKLLAKPLGRPSAVLKHVSPGDHNPIEDKFGQAKTANDLNRIRAKLRETSESWIACIFLVLNLVKLVGVVFFCFLSNMIKSFSAKRLPKSLMSFIEDIQNKVFLLVLQSNPEYVIMKNLCRVFQQTLFIHFINAFHNLPFIIGCGICGSILKPGNISFPFGLTWFDSQFFHCFLVIKIRNCIHYHK